MQCPRCRASMPEVSHFCHMCGQDLRSPDLARRKSFAVKPDEPVASLALVSTIMPRGAAEKPQTYRLALLMTLVVALACAIFGAMPLALMVAAFAIPIVYIVYLYDVNLWEDEPLPVTILAFGLTFALSLGWTLLWQWLRGPDMIRPGLNDVTDSLSLKGFLIGVVLAVVVGEAIRHLGPILLASRPQFDDLMDGLTFGIISGVAYSAAETLVTQWPLMSIGFAGNDVDPFVMASLIFLHGFVKPLLYGTAVGLACAEFSGLGKGYDGFTGRYARATVISLVAILAYNGIVYWMRALDNPALELALALLLGLAILAVLILMLRSAMHKGLMEAAMEKAARVDHGVGAQGELHFCTTCEMPTLPGAAFCNACGTTLRAETKRRQPVAAPAMATAGAPAAAATETVGQQPTEADAWFDKEEGNA